MLLDVEWAVKRFVTQEKRLVSAYHKTNVTKSKVRRVYNRSKLGEHYEAELKRLSKKLLIAKRNAQETFLTSVLQNEVNPWSEFYWFVNRRKGNRENIPTIKD